MVQLRDDHGVPRMVRRHRLSAHTPFEPAGHGGYHPGDRRGTDGRDARVLVHRKIPADARPGARSGWEAPAKSSSPRKERGKHAAPAAKTAKRYRMAPK